MIFHSMGMHKVFNLSVSQLVCLNFLEVRILYHRLSSSNVYNPATSQHMMENVKLSEIRVF
jgi:hypothetical protein